MGLDRQAVEFHYRNFVGPWCDQRAAAATGGLRIHSECRTSRRTIIEVANDLGSRRMKLLRNILGR